MVIERLRPPASEEALDGLADLLVDAVESGSSVSFMADIDFETARDWWEETLGYASARSIFLLAEDSEGVVGTVNALASWQPNGQHRAEVTKLLVHQRARNQGLGQRLMLELEAQARRERFTLLNLDTCRGDAGYRLYKRLGWTEVGGIPGYARYPDGQRWCETVIFYKSL